MDVVVSRAMRDQQFPFQLSRILHRRRIDVVLLVLLWQAHVAFGVNGVVKMQIGDGPAREANFENVSRFQQSRCGHKTAETPAPNADTAGVNPGLLS